MHTKFIFVTGGVVSSLGKGITAASLGRLLKSRGLRVSMQKFDPYINVDPGTMNPYQHGEVFVTDDGAETDLDLGHYERFIDENLTQAANVTSGRVYDTVITRERKGEYLGATIQVIPHITDEIKRRMLAVSLREDAPDVVITEIGGTVGDIESLPFLEAARQLKNEVGRENVLYIHVTLVPYISAAGELKTKPTQHSVKELTGLGIQPDIIVCRSEKALTRDVRAKIGLFCNIPADCVFENLNARSIYEVPLMIHEEGMDERVCRVLGTQAVDILGTFGRIDQHEHVVILDLDYAGGNCGNLFSSVWRTQAQRTGDDGADRVGMSGADAVLAVRRRHDQRFARAVVKRVVGGQNMHAEALHCVFSLCRCSALRMASSIVPTL